MFLYIVHVPHWIVHLTLYPYGWQVSASSSCCGQQWSGPASSSNEAEKNAQTNCCRHGIALVEVSCYYYYHLLCFWGYLSSRKRLPWHCLHVFSPCVRLPACFVQNPFAGWGWLGWVVGRVIAHHCTLKDWLTSIQSSNSVSAWCSADLGLAFNWCIVCLNLCNST